MPALQGLGCEAENLGDILNTEKRAEVLVKVGPGAHGGCFGIHQLTSRPLVWFWGAHIPVSTKRASGSTPKHKKNAMIREELADALGPAAPAVRRDDPLQRPERLRRSPGAPGGALSASEVAVGEVLTFADAGENLPGEGYSRWSVRLWSFETTRCLAAHGVAVASLRRRRNDSRVLSCVTASSNRGSRSTPMPRRVASNVFDVNRAGEVVRPSARAARCAAHAGR